MSERQRKNTKAYDNKFYKALLKVAREYAGSYTIMVSSLQELAMMMDMPFSDAWFFALNRFSKSNQGFVKKVPKGYIIEVLPF